MPHPRVVSLLPSATEIICALGAERLLVGVSHECDFPESVRALPVLTRTRLPGTGTSASIDRSVRDLVRDALAIYAIDENKLAECAPDVIVTQDLCEVCAVSLDDVRSAVARLTQKSGVEIVSLHPVRLADVLADHDRVARALGREEAGNAFAKTLRARIDAIAERAHHAATSPRVVSVEWLDPLMLGGTWMPELIELAGGTPVGARAGEAAPTVRPESLAQLAPDVVLLKPCGYPIAKTLAERSLIAERIAPYVPRTTALYVSDGNAYFNRPGPRLVESLEILASVIHPELFPDFAEKYRNIGVVSFFES